MAEQNLFKILLTFCLIAHLFHFAQVWAEVDDASFDKINEYLTRRTSSTEASTNMRIAIEWLGWVKSASNPEPDQALIEALETFTSLSRLKGDQGNVMCNRDGYNILVANDVATHGRAHKHQSRPHKLRRLDYVVYQYSFEHAEYCKELYKITFDRLSSRFPSGDMQRVEGFVKRLMSKKYSFREFAYNWSERTLVENVMIMKWSDKKMAKAAYDEIVALGSQDRFDAHTLGAMRRVDESQVRDLFTRYVTGPCERFVQSFGPDLFVLEDYDAKMMTRHKYYTSRPVSHFRFIWACFKVCSSLVDRSLQDQVFGKLVRTFSKESSHRDA